MRAAPCGAVNPLRAVPRLLHKLRGLELTMTTVTTTEFHGAFYEILERDFNEAITEDAKFTDADILEHEQQLSALAHAYLEVYSGNFSFLLDMRVARDKWGLSVPQIRGVVNCIRRGAIDAAAPKVKTDAPSVANGRYAITLADKLRFFRIKTPSEGNWAGFTFVDELTGGLSLNTFPVKNKASKLEILMAIAADDGALARFGQELGICGVCGSPLTDATSRELGIGPICRGG